MLKLLLETLTLKLNILTSIIKTQRIDGSVEIMIVVKRSNITFTTIQFKNLHLSMI